MMEINALPFCGEIIEKAFVHLKDNPRYIPPTILAVGAVAAAVNGQEEIALGLGLCCYLVMPKAKERRKMHFKDFSFEHCVG